MAEQHAVISGSVIVSGASTDPPKDVQNTSTVLTKTVAADAVAVVTTAKDNITIAKEQAVSLLTTLCQLNDTKYYNLMRELANMIPAKLDLPMGYDSSPSTNKWQPNPTDLPAIKS